MCRDSLRNVIRRSLIASALLALLLPQGAIAQTSYNPCNVPPEIAFSTQPNILLIMDFSGSMQQQAYYQTTGTTNYSGSQTLDEGTTVINASAYDPTNNPASTTAQYYFGLFDNTLYYKYDATNGIFYSVGSTPTSGTSNNIGTVTTGLSGALLNWALTSRLDSALKALIGGKSYDSTDTNATGYVGTSTTPVNCVPGVSSSCYLKAQGARRYVSETTNINAQFYIRPDAWTSTVSGGLNVNYPDSSSTSWDSDGACSSTAGSTCFPNRDLVVSIRGNYIGNPGLNTTLTGTSKSPYWSGTSGRVYDRWSFTVSQTTNVDITYTATGWSPSSSNKAQLVLSTSATPGTSVLQTVNGNNNSPNLQYQCTAGTYYIYITNSSTSTTLGAYGITSNVPLTPVVGGCVASTQNTIGGIPYARVRVQIDPNSLDPTANPTTSGVVRANWTKGRYGFMYYKGDDSSHEGKILAPCGKYISSADMYNFIRKIQGQPASTDTKSTYDWQPWPYSGTPTGEAFNEVYNYLTQSSSSVNGSDVISKGNVPQDPYYTQVNVNGTMVNKPVSCRTTYVIHMSDGNWFNNSGSTTDPIPKIWQLHTANLRPEIATTGMTPINANIFSILAFASPSDCDNCSACSNCSSCSGKKCTSCTGGTGFCANTCVPLCDYFLGQNSMQWAAMYGGFNTLSGCTPSTYPWPKSDTSFNSATTPFCMAQCTPSSSVSSGGVYNCTGTTSPNRCCAEWNSNKDPSRKGMPDNYYYAQNGAQLQTSLNAIVSNITQQLGSSSAVATVAQQNTEGALVIRGAFEARGPTTDAADAGRFLWFGHLESYWPDQDGNYDFQLFTSQADTLCKGLMGDALAANKINCWDAAMSTDPKTGPWPSPASRAVYTSKKDSSGVWHLIQLTDSNIVSSPSNTQLGPTDFGVADLATAKALVQWVLGTDQTVYKSRQYGGSGAYWILGDIVYSTPVVIGPPSLAATPSKTKAIISNTEVGVSIPNDAASASPVSFNKFFLDWRNCDPYNTGQTLASGATCPGKHIKYRDKVVYVGANDGMIHAFLLSVYDSANDNWAVAPNDYFIADSTCSSAGGGKNILTGTCGKPTNGTDGLVSDANRIKMIGQEIFVLKQIWNTGTIFFK